MESPTALLNRAKHAALNYIARGWSPIPVKQGSKAPHGAGWQNQRLTLDEVERRFGPTENVGVLLGEPSGWLVDVDLDTPEALALAARMLPPTLAKFGRASKPESHLLYLSQGAEFAKYVHDGDTLVELRTTGQQTIFPGSVHPGGERIEWSTSGEAGRVSASELSQAVARLAVAALLMRRGRDLEGAVRIAMDDAALLEISDSTGSTIRAWLGLAPKAAPQRKAKNADLEEAIARYNTEHSREWPRSGGDCPGCGHKGCFGTLPGAKRWYCFSSAHERPGVHGRHGYHGDALDLDAHAAGVSRIDLLRRTGHLPERFLRSVPKGGDGDGATPRGRDSREIIISSDIEQTTNEALEALADAGSEVYHRGGLLVQVVVDESIKSDGVVHAHSAPRLAQVEPIRLRELMSSSAKWLQYENRGGAPEGERALKPAMPPEWVAKAALSRGRWPELRRLSSVIEVPVLRPDGSVVDKPGYDDATGLLYQPCAGVVVPEAPTQYDALEAKNVLLDAVRDFPIASDEHKASWLACVLTPFARYAYDGPTPLFLVDANTRGSGKSMLADIAGRIACGRPLARMPPSDDEPEERKRITAIAIAGTRMAMIDNVKGQLGTSALDAALTSTTWSDRVLGTANMFEGKLDTVFIATGNNVELGGDMSRRVCYIRLESPHEKPETRNDFSRPNILQWVAAEQPKLATAALTMLRAYCLAGKPEQSIRTWGSYEGWNRLVAHAIKWVGLPDISAAREELSETGDEERMVLLSFLREFKKYATWGATVADLLHDVERSPETYSDLRAALVSFCPSRAGIPSPRSLGYKLRSARGRVVGGMCLDQSVDRDENGTKWVVR